MATQQNYDFRNGWPVNPAAPPTSHEAKAPFVERGTGPISRERYFSTEWMQRERELLWPKVWNWAAREEDVPEPGDFKTFSLGSESFLIIRGEDDRVRAFFNVCPHRGNRLVFSETGTLPRGITCPFHNWRFDYDGRIANVTDRETFRPEALARNLDLSEVRCETWEGFIFINMDRNAAPLLEKLGPLPEHAKPYGLANMRIMRRVQSVWPANWKVGFDGFAESYHVHAIHPQILPIFNDYHAQIDLFANGMTRSITKFANESPRLRSTQLSAGLRAAMIDVGLDPDTFKGHLDEVRLAVQAAKRARAAQMGLDYSGFLDGQLTDDWNYAIYPNILLGLHPEGANLLYFRPHPTDPRQFIFDVIILMHPQKDASILPPAYMGLPPGTDLTGRTAVETVIVDWREGGLGQLFDQDSNLFSQIQQGVESAGFRGSILSDQEARIAHFHAELDRYMGVEKPPSEQG